jgi:hypothetical protein
MDYLQLFNLLKDKVSYTPDYIDIDESIELHNLTFHSASYRILPGEEMYECAQHKLQFDEKATYQNEYLKVEEGLDVHDSQVDDNQTFRYHIFKPKNTGKAKEVILFLHGFNEKYWNKYLPWAHKLCKDTGKTMVLFPIAFHMNRAPHLWSNRRAMHQASEERRQHFPEIVHSSLSNVAISVRLHAKPQRFIWSGLQTYHDVIRFVEDCKAGNHPLIDAGFNVDFFAYSIGSLLAEILKLTDYKGYFTQAKMAMFCGGAVFNRLSPVSKFIIDSEASVALYSYLVEHLENHVKKDTRLAHFLDAKHPEGNNFISMLNYKMMRQYREKRFMEMADKVLAITLDKDTIIPPYEVINTLKGVAHNIQIPVNVYDFDYDYKHEDPFPASAVISEPVNQAFQKVFDEFAAFLS